MDLLKPGNPSILTRHLGRLPGGGSPEAMPAKADEGGGLALEGTSKGRRDKPKLGHTQGRQLLPLSRAAPTPTIQRPHTPPCLRTGAVPGAAPTSQPILPVTSQHGEFCSHFTEEKSEAQRGLIISLRPHSSQIQSTWHCGTFLALWDVLQKYSAITILHSGRLFILNKG